MAEQELVNYIKKALASGSEQGVIRQKLLGVGWPATDVDEAFFLLKQDGEYAVRDDDKPEHHKASKPKELLIASLALIAIAAVIYVLHVMNLF